MSNSPLSLYDLTNLQAPADGTTHATKLTLQLIAGTPQIFDWATVGNDYSTYTPQAIFVDNSAGTAVLQIVETRYGYTLNIPAGVTQIVQILGFNEPIFSISGSGPVNLFFLDFPAFPLISGSGNLVEVTDGSGLVASVASTGLTNSLQVLNVAPNGQPMRSPISGMALLGYEQHLLTSAVLQLYTVPLNTKLILLSGSTASFAGASINVSMNGTPPTTNTGFVVNTQATSYVFDDATTISSQYLAAFCNTSSTTILSAAYYG
jgi:hypothetical protein